MKDKEEKVMRKVFTLVMFVMKDMEEKRMRKNIALVMLTGLLISSMVGCASTKAGPSGFLGDYSKLGPGREGGVNQIYLKEGVDFKKYNKIMMEPVEFYFKDNPEYKGIEANQLKELSDAFHQEVAKALEGAYPLVAEPGPDVMRIRVAITSLDKSKPVQSVMTSISPATIGISLIGKATTGEWIGVGSASMEAEIIDSQSGQVIGQAVDQRSGGKLAGFTTLGGAKAAFEFWAKRLRIWLDETHGK
jgi:hypothetical protein